MVRPGRQLGRLGPVVAASEAEAWLGPEAADDADGLLEPVDLVLRGADPEPEGAELLVRGASPSPRMSRPPDSRSRVSAILATIAGWR
jgi:hypothetical protein